MGAFRDTPSKHVHHRAKFFQIMPFPDIDPIAFSIGVLHIRWYGIAYVAGILLGWLYSRHLIQKYSHHITATHLDDFIVWATLGIIIGGRLGEVVFYNFDYYWNHPLEILQIWHPGMSFHGGLLGVVVVTIAFCWKHKIPLLGFADILACAAPIGLFFGRIANFINGELFGRITDVPWGVIFPYGGNVPRHPSQLYEALLEGFVLFSVLCLLEKRTSLRQKVPGFLFAVFLMGYACARIFVEFFRQPDVGISIAGYTPGQVLSFPLLLVGGGMAIGLFQYKSE